MWLRPVKPAHSVNKMNPGHYKISGRCLSPTKPLLCHSADWASYSQMRWCRSLFRFLCLPARCVFLGRGELNMLFCDRPHLKSKLRSFSWSVCKLKLELNSALSLSLTQNDSCSKNLATFWKPKLELIPSDCGAKQSHSFIFSPIGNLDWRVHLKSMFLAHGRKIYHGNSSQKSHNSTWIFLLLCNYNSMHLCYGAD